MSPTQEDPQAARSIPDEYASLRSRSGRRVLDLLERHWGDRQEGELRQLAQVLVTILAPLDQPDAEVTDDLRTACEQVVASWIRTTTPVAPRHREALPEPGRRQIRLVAAYLAAEEDGQWWAGVTLERASAGRHAVRVRCRPDTPTDQIRAGAEAALEALRQAVSGGDLVLELREAVTFEALDRTGVMVSIAVSRGQRQSTAVGVCTDIAGDPVRAAAIAVLNATNRRLGFG
ncbi:MAG: hypothetical protein HY700_00825 [Gemmatimonadetes bacterium]|nr:hypothetical protein [Gemmatimonadota bacterium]